MYIEFKPGQKYAAKGADVSDKSDAFSDCGYLLEEKDIVIDIDSIGKDAIKAFIDTFEIDTQVVWTDRGAHLYFEKPSDFVRAKNGPCALGFEIETKTRKNTPRGITVKRNGVLREVEGIGKRQMLPWYFYSQKQYLDLYGMEEGRNKALFALRMKLEGHEDSLKILRFVNENLFPQPLDEEEFQHVCRDYDPVEMGGGKEFDIANSISNQYSCVLYQGTLWWWNGKRYVTEIPGHNEFNKLVYDRCPGKNTRFVDEVIRQISYRCKVADIQAFPIRLKNGIVTEGGFIEAYDYRDFTPFYIDIPFYSDAETVPEVDEYIDNITGGDPDYRKLLLEAMAYVMVTDPEKIRLIGQFFMFRGDGANGKGTLLQIMKKIYGEDNCTALSIKDLTDMRYQVTLVGKLANLGDDVQPEAINNDQMKVLKNICTADTVSTRQLYKQSMNATFTAKMYFTTNSDIRSFEKGYAYKRRVKWMPMFNKVEKPDPMFISRMTSEKALQYWMKLLVEAYMRLATSWKFTESEVVEEYNRQYHVENNYMAVFLETLDIDTDLIGKTGPEVKLLYNQYNDDDTKPYRPKLLGEILKEMGIGKGSQNINGKACKVFMYQKDTKQKLF